MAQVLRPARVLLPLLALASSVLTACGEGPPGEPLGESAQALETYPNEQPAFDYFRARGLTSEQSAGIVGNFDVESGLDPKSVQQGGPGRGIAQWSAGARWDTIRGDNVKDYAAGQGKDALSLQLQLDFVWFELTTFPAYGLAKLKATTSVSAATSSFATNYEGCGTCNTATRVAHAQSVLDRFAANPVDGGSSGGDPPVACMVQATGESGQCLTTAACATLGNHVSTPGFCPGAADVQCCTAAAGGASSSDGGSGATKGSSRGGADDASDGCSASRSAPARGGPATWLLGAAALLVARRRSRACL